MVRSLDSMGGRPAVDRQSGSHKSDAPLGVTDGRACVQHGDTSLQDAHASGHFKRMSVLSTSGDRAPELEVQQGARSVAYFQHLPGNYTQAHTCITCGLVHPYVPAALVGNFFGD